MSTIGRIAVTLTANAAKFEAGMAKGRKSIDRFVRGSAMRQLRRLPAVFAAAGAGAAVGLAMLTRSSMKSIDNTAKLSDRLDIATERLTGLQYAAEITGAGTETLNKGLQYMEKGLGEAAQGIGEAKYALDALGISADSLKGLSTDQKFYAIADAISRVEDTSTRAFVAQKMFGRAGLALINMLSGGSRALQQYQTDADNLGITFNRIDAGKVEQANDSLHRLGQVSVGVGNVLATAVSPIITDVAERLIRFGTEGEGAVGKVSAAFGGLLDVVTKVKDGMDFLGSIGNRVKQGFAQGYSWWEKYTPLGRLKSAVYGSDAELMDKYAEHAGAKAKEAWDRIGSKNAAAVDDYIKKANKKAEAAAKATTGQAAAAGAGVNLSGGGSPAGKTQTAMIINRSLMGITPHNGAAKIINTRTAQLDTTNQLLARIEHKLGGAPVVG